MERVIKNKPRLQFPTHDARKAGLSDVAGFFIGSRESINRVAAAPDSLWLGIALVLTAGLARNYDHHHLIQEPLWIIGPVSMAMVSSLFIYSFLENTCGLKCESDFRGKSIVALSIGFFLAPAMDAFLAGLSGVFLGFLLTVTIIVGGIILRVMAVTHTPRGRKNFLAFFRCFLMTAPIAWIYGIPVERWMDPERATRVNLMLLVVVALWRVFLMIRVVQVLYKPGYQRAVMSVLIPASIEMFIGSFILKSRMVSIMGGISEEHDPFLLSVTSIIMITCATIVGFGVIAWFIPALYPQYATRLGFSNWIANSGKHFRRNAINLSRNAWVLPVAGLFLFGIPAIINQGSLANRIQFKRFVENDQFAEAAEILNARRASDFPQFDSLGISIINTLEFLDSGEKIPDWAQEKIDVNLNYFAHRMPFDWRLANRMSKYSASDQVDTFIRKWVENKPERKKQFLDHYEEKRKDYINENKR